MLNKPILPLSDKLAELRTALDTFFGELSREYGRATMAGQIILWPDGIAVPEGWVECDGTDHMVKYPELVAMFGDGVVPNITAPTGSIAIIKVSS